MCKLNDPLVVTWQQNGGCRPVSLRDDIDGRAVGQTVPTQEPEAVYQRELILCDVFGVQLSPIAAPVPAYKLCRLLASPGERFGCARCSDELASRQVGADGKPFSSEGSWW
jgi:hypothetical protein